MEYLWIEEGFDLGIGIGDRKDYASTLEVKEGDKSLGFVKLVVLPTKEVI